MNTNVQTIHQMGFGINAMVKQATGRESVSNIDMDWVSVEQLARYIYGSGSGDVVSFNTNIPDAIDSLIAYIEAVQDLNGYAYPWPAGGGKNLVNVDDFSASSTNVTLTINGNEIHAVGNGEATYLNVRITIGKKAYPAGTYYVKFKIKSGAVLTDYTKLSFRTSEGVVKGSISITSDTLEYSDTVTIDDSCYLAIMLNGSSTGEDQATDITVYDLIVSETDIPYEPYSNVCPITGWTGCTVTDANMLDSSDPDYYANIYSFTWQTEAGTVYGGTLDVLTGVLTVEAAVITFPEFTQINDSTKPDSTGKVVRVSIPAAKYSSTDVNFKLETAAAVLYANAGAAWTAFLNSSKFLYVYVPADATTDSVNAALTGSKIWYKLATPVIYQLTAQEVTALIGQNTIFADTGNVSVQYKVKEDLL